MNDSREEVERAAAVIQEADALIIGAGAGMGVDSGLPDFRGKEGFWKAYPPFARLGLSFSEAANPRWFRHDPALAWGFYGHRLNLYRRTEPHHGFAILKRWGEWARLGSFVYTSNVDGHFQKAGFDSDRIVECHGTIHRMQCLAGCGIEPFDAESTQVGVDPESFRASEPWPICPACGALARPNILMFGDADWESALSDDQARRMSRWLHSMAGVRLVVVELGAGTAVATVRYLCEELALRHRAPLVRINPRDAETPRGQISIPLGALDALGRIDQLLNPGDASR